MCLSSDLVAEMTAKVESFPLHLGIAVVRESASTRRRKRITHCILVLQRKHPSQWQSLAPPGHAKRPVLQAWLPRLLILF